MSKLVYICARAGSRLPYDEQDIERLSFLLTPDNINPRPPHIIAGDGVLIGIINPTESLPIKGSNICLGALFGERGQWWRVGSAPPEGTYALFRCDGNSLELVSDIVATRTIWYTLTDELFIASTSQRAIIYLLQDFQPNRAVYPWVLSTGTLGPGLSWDQRLRCLGPDSVLTLDRSAWKFAIRQRPVIYQPQALPAKEHMRLLQQAIEETFNSLDINLNQWILPLSGGYDSRAIFLLLKDRHGLRTVTWGRRSALEDDRSDAHVAMMLARRYGVAHDYFDTDLSDEPVESVFKRFLVAGEGRTDHISGYMDGFYIWKRLYESGCEGIIRGDEAFGCNPVRNDHNVYENMSLKIISDYEGAAAIETALGAEAQVRPKYLERQSGESLEIWRDRVNAQYEMPFVFSALNDVKLPYVEIIQPLLSRKIVECVRMFPNELRTGKALFKKIVENMEPKERHAFASNVAIESRDNILSTDKVVSEICNRLRRTKNSDMHLHSLASCAVNLIDGDKIRLLNRISSIHNRIVEVTKKLFRVENVNSKLNPYNFGFRVYMIVEMKRMLEEDVNETNELIK